MDETPLLTIAIPNFNYGRYLDRCLRSAIVQVGDDIEILVADNCSVDESWSVINRFADPRIRVWRHKQNIGLYPNWNFLLSQARGRFFKLLPSDDWLEPNFGTELRNCLQSTTDHRATAILLGYSHSDMRTMSTNRSSNISLPRSSGIPDIFIPADNFDLVLLSLSYSMPTFNALNTHVMQRVGGYQPEDARRSDSILFTRLIANEPTWPVLCCNEPVVVMSLHDSNAHASDVYSRFSVYRDEIIFLSELTGLASGRGESELLGRTISQATKNALISLLKDLIKRKNLREFAGGFRWLWKSGSARRSLATQFQR